MYSSKEEPPASSAPAAKFLKPKIIAPPIHSYVSQVGFRESAIARQLRLATAAHPKSVMMGDPLEAALFQWLLNLTQATTIVEVGVFTGYTTLIMAEALKANHPDGDNARIIALDVNDEFPNVGKPFWKEASVDDMIDLRIAPALDSLKAMNDNTFNDNLVGTVDFAFIDADKVNYRAYYEALLPLMRPGKGIIAIDNVLWSGKVVEEDRVPPGADADTDALRALNAFVVTDDRVEHVLLPIADGVTLVRKK